MVTLEIADAMQRQPVVEHAFKLRPDRPDSGRHDFIAGQSRHAADRGIESPASKVVAADTDRHRRVAARSPAARRPVRGRQAASARDRLKLAGTPTG